MNSITVNAYAALNPKGQLTPFNYELPELGPEDIDVKVQYCGICHSDLSMLNNEWHNTEYPFVPGHEIIGEVVAVGALAKGLQVGDQVGVGWFSSSCMHCNQCIGGDHHLCSEKQATIGGRHGGFADHVRCHWAWATRLPEGLNASTAGPLLCGGITVFQPILQHQIKPTHRVGVIGIGGLGHLALQFLNKWGCEVTAFSSSPDKAAECHELGAHHVVNSRDEEAMQGIAGTLDFIINTANVTLNWQAYLKTLAPHGILHTVGAVLEPMQIPAFALIGSQKSVSGSPVGSPAATREMLAFCARHNIAPVTEQFPLQDVNDAMKHLASGKARYRVVLKV